MSEIPGNMTEVDEDWLFSLLQNDTKFETDKTVSYTNLTLPTIALV